jgi:hypothetical protein
MTAFLRPRRIAALAAAAACLAASTAAYGYWTTTGAGTGTASVAASGATLVLHGAVPSALVPGAAATVSFTADNPGPSSLELGTIHLDGVVADPAHAGCAGADFAMADVPTHTRVPANVSGYALAGTGSLRMADTDQNQDACKGATLTLTLSGS